MVCSINLYAIAFPNHFNSLWFVAYKILELKWNEKDCSKIDFSWNEFCTKVQSQNHKVRTPHSKMQNIVYYTQTHKLSILMNYMVQLYRIGLLAFNVEFIWVCVCMWVWVRAIKIDLCLQINWRKTQKPLIVKSLAISLQISQSECGVRVCASWSSYYREQCILYCISIACCPWISMFKNFEHAIERGKFWARNTVRYKELSIFYIIFSSSSVHLPLGRYWVWSASNFIEWKDWRVEWSSWSMAKLTHKFAIFVYRSLKVCVRFTHNLTKWKLKRFFSAICA